MAHYNSYNKTDQPRDKWEDGMQSTNQNYSTPHQKTLGGGIGVEKAAGMGKVTKIGVKMK